jgi:hypothetical protein
MTFVAMPFRLDPVVTITDFARRNQDFAPNWGAPKQAPKREKTAQFVLKKVLARMLDRQGVEIKAEGKDAVRAVCEDEVRTVFEADYIATHTDSSDVGQAWRRARNHPAAGVTGDVVNGVPYLWRSVP